MRQLYDCVSVTVTVGGEGLPLHWLDDPVAVTVTVGVKCQPLLFDIWSCTYHGYRWYKGSAPCVGYMVLYLSRLQLV